MKSHTIRGGGTVGRRRGGTVAVALVTLVLAGTLTACSSTEAQPATSTSSGSSGGSTGIPSSAFSDTTGLTSSTVTVGNVSTLAFGLFKGADVGTEAWADYVNSTGGINGRKLVVDSYDDGYQGAPNKQATEQVVQKDFAAVGGFSLEDSYGETVLAANPGVPNVTVSLSQSAGDLPNSFSPADVLQAEVPGRREARRGTGGRPALGHHEVGRREGGDGVARLRRRL